MSDTTTEYGIDHFGTDDVETEDYDGDKFENLAHVREEFAEMNYGNARIVKREVTEWTEVAADE